MYVYIRVYYNWNFFLSYTSSTLKLGLSIDINSATILANALVQSKLRTTVHLFLKNDEKFKNRM